MARAEAVEGRLLPVGEAREAVQLPQRVHAVAAPGEDLVRVALVRHVPYDLVLGGIEHIVQRDRQLHHAQRGPQVAADLAD